jgi:hypothetical protein
MKSLVIYALLDPSAAPDDWTYQSVRLLNAAYLLGRCQECGAVAKDLGIDHREVWHRQLDHEDDCRASEESIAEHLDEIGVDIDWPWFYVSFERQGQS